MSLRLIPQSPPSDADLLAEVRAQELKVLSEAQPAVEDIRNALTILNTCDPLTVVDVCALDRLLRSAVVKLDAVRALDLLRERVTARSLCEVVR